MNYLTDDIKHQLMTEDLLEDGTFINNRQINTQNLFTTQTEQKLQVRDHTMRIETHSKFKDNIFDKLYITDHVHYKIFAYNGKSKIKKHYNVKTVYAITLDRMNQNEMQAIWETT